MDDIVSYAMGKKKGGVQPTGEIEITQNGITNVSGYATANVQVPEKQLEEKSVTISSNTTTLIEPSSGKDGMSSVSVTTNVPQPSGKITITENGTDIDVSSYATADISVSGDISEYFKTTLTSNVDNWKSIMKKYPEISINGTSIAFMFQNYNGYLQPPKISDTSNITDFRDAFESATLSTIKTVEDFDISSATDMRYMFAYCYNLKTLDLSNWVNLNYIQIGSMFDTCYQLEELDMSNFDFTMSSPNSSTFSYVPANCLIYVKDQTQVDWFATEFPSLTNVQIKGA